MRRKAPNTKSNININNNNNETGLSESILDPDGRHPKQLPDTRTKPPFSLSTRTSATPTPHRRQPLRSRDQNAMMRVTPKSPLQSTLNGNNNMPPLNSYASDKQTIGNGTPRHFMPTLSAASLKVSNRTPLTPRVAGSTTIASPSSAQAQNNFTTPSSRSRIDTRTPGIGRDRPREDVSTPVSTFISNNITPRSGSRKSRVDSTNTTPTGTPNGQSYPSPSHEPLRAAPYSPSGSGLGISTADKDGAKRPNVSFASTIAENAASKGSGQSNLGDSRFFFASDAKTVQSPRPTLPPAKSSSFLYANGSTIPGLSQTSNESNATSPTEETYPKFFHANGAPDARSPPYLPPPRPSSIVSSSSRMTSPRLPPSSPSIASPVQRPVSPSKLNQQSSVISPRPLAVVARPGVVGRGQSASIISSPRRSSLENVRLVSHGRSASVGSVDSSVSSHRHVSGGSVGDPARATPPLNLVATSVPLSTPEEINDDQAEGLDTSSDLQSPTKTHSLEHMNELAANARRERKVLDLEITNSSLAAINRTLEREMRKQTAELRRYRRLSRSGRLSIATTASMRTSGDSMSLMNSTDGTQLTDLSEEESSEDEDSDYSEESVDDGTLSPKAMAESDLRHRQRDEKRLQLDLSKHQQLLIDSQKMNQSLKRCLGWTEELINEGRKALAYSVHVSDVELGGRVLPPDEVEEENTAVELSAIFEATPNDDESIETSAPTHNFDSPV